MDEAWLKDASQHGIEGLVNHSVFYTCLSNVAYLWILNKKRGIFAVAVGPSHKLTVQAKNISFHMATEVLDVFSLCLSFAEFKPCFEKPFD